ncbi:MAG: hypothetical protein R3C60_06890 [Parvularculaceae bacterium]
MSIGNSDRNAKSHSKLLIAIPTIFWFAATVALAFYALVRFFHPVQFEPYEYWWLTSVAAALFIFGILFRSEWRIFGVVSASFIAGYGVQLALRRPLWFQHIRITPTSDLSYLMLMVFALQGAVAVYVLSRSGVLKNAPQALAKSELIPLGLTLMVLVLASVGALDFIGTNDYFGWLKQTVVASAFLTVNILSICALAVTAPANGLGRLSKFIEQRLSLPGHKPRIRKFDSLFPYWLAGVAFFICLLMRLVVFENLPRIDEITYLAQAKYFASGHLWLPAPPSPESFDVFMMDEFKGRWFATWPPGWPLALSFGVLINMPWVINPLLAALSVILLHAFVLGHADRGTANLSALLLATSTWFLSMSSTLMSHTFITALVLGSWVLITRTRSKPSYSGPLVAGALMGMIFLTRPLDGVLIGVLTGLWVLSFVKRRAGYWKTVISYSAGCIVIGGLVFSYNIILAGDPLSTPLNAFLDKAWGPGANSLGFGPNIGASGWGGVDKFPGYSPMEALIQAQQMFYSLNFELFGWGVGSVAFVLIFIFWGKWTRFTAAMAGLISMTILTFAFYWYGASFYAGPRYWFLILVPMVVLSAAGIAVFVGRVGKTFPGVLAAERVAAAVGVLCACSMISYLSWVAFNKYPGFRGYHDDYRVLANQAEFKNSLIFVSTDSDSEYENAFWLNDFAPRSKSALFARDLGKDIDLRVASTYPDRSIYFVKGRSEKNPHIVVVRGPLRLDDLR